ncbi:MAG: hypothetical protein O9972_58380 [Burkholderiales bacterium]|nr:hypothetical protein [Burkholderiales bacterium]
MLVAEPAAPTARAASAVTRAPLGPPRTPDRLIERLDVHFAADANAVSVLLVTPDGPMGEPRPRAVWPPRSIPPAAVVHASARALRAEGVLTACVDERRPQGATVLATRIETRDRLLGIVSVQLDGSPPELARSIERWLELFERLAGTRPEPTAQEPEVRGPAADAPAAHAGQAHGPIARGPTDRAPMAPPGIATAASPSAADGEAAARPATRASIRPGWPVHDAALAGAVADGTDDAIEDPAAALRAIACHRALFRAPRLDDGVRALLAVLARQHGCVRVACGWTAASRREGIVVSGAAEERPSRALRDAYAAAMDEALARTAAAAWPEVPGHAGGLPVAQSRLAGLRGVVAVCSVPLGGHGRAPGALILERVGAPFDAATIDELERVAAFVGPALAASRRSERPLAAWLADLRGVLPRSRSAPPSRVGRAAR